MDYLIKPTVSVCMITFNHERFIRQAIEGILMQKCNFSYELVIGEDLSTDGTRSICLDYAERFPEIIRVNTRETNLGMMRNFQKTLEECFGMYIAICEGDDYWTDTYKLQKQVDFMEANPEYSFCFHNAIKIFEDSNLKSSLFNSLDEENFHCFESLVNRKWFIPTASMLFRNKSIQLPEWFQTVKNGDFALELLLAKEGPFYFMPDVMSVYRFHNASITALRGLNNITLFDSITDILQNVKELYPFNKHWIFDERILQLENERKLTKRNLDYPILKFFNIKTYTKFLGRLLSIQRRTQQ